ncbi:cobalt-precorrin-6A reductase [Nocardioides sp. CPCC 205120]|uniref:cobalt-precorrin-6A reductase n=1 Tax=Nocardioides sp. CPCC 205120 TaxID=3406462 RepID=UPI003B5118A5
MILLLGGTAEARDLARVLVEAGEEVVSSLAGRVARPRLPVGETRVGGFGGVDGLAAWLVEHGARAVVDATHPFAVGISGNARAACARTGTPLLRLERPGWSGEPGADTWTWVDDVAGAARAAAGLGARPFLTVGRQGLDDCTGPLTDAAVLARVVDPPEVPLPDGWRVLLDRGPYTVAGERALVAEHRADVLVTKDSGGDLTRAKLDVARELGLPVVVVRRPSAVRAPGADAPEVAHDVAAAASWVRAVSGAR